MKFDNIANGALEVCRELFRFLGIDEDLVPLIALKKVNQAIAPRFQFADFMTKATGRVMRVVGLYKPLTLAKRSDRIRGIFFKNLGYQTQYLMTERAKAVIDFVVRPEISMLENPLSA